MRRHQIVFLLGVVLLAGTCLSGCTQQQNTELSPFIGTWIGTYAWAGNFTHTVPANITFRTDGTYHASIPLIRDDGTWTVDGVILTKTMNGSTPVEYTFLFSQNDTNLLLTSSSLLEQWNLAKLASGPY